MEDKKLYTDFDGRTYTENDEECTFAETNHELSREALGGIGGNPLEFKTVSSKLHLSLFLYLITTYAVLYVFSIMIGIVYSIWPTDALTNVIDSGTFNILLSSTAQYAIAFPIFAYVAKILLAPKSYEKSKLPLGEFFVLLLISESLMLIGSIIGSFASQIVGNIFGISPNNSLDSILDDTPMWLVVISVVILAPIFEEIIYRKMFMDRLGDMGDGYAILFSAVAFALMHSNMYQFFYAFFVGIVFGYVYVRTRDVRYTIAMHMILNFLGSIVTIPVVKAADRQVELSEAISSGAVVDELEYAITTLIVFMYSSVQIMLIIGGLVALALYLNAKRVKYVKNTENTQKEVLRAGFINVGTLLFIGLCLILTLLNIIQGA